MRFFKEGSASVDNYKEAIAIMEEETIKNYHFKENMERVLIGGLLLLIISVTFALLRAGPWSYAGVIISMAIIYAAFKKWQVSRMEMCFSIYSYELLKKEYLELFEINKLKTNS